MGSETFFLETEMLKRRLRIQACLFFKLCLFELQTPANDGKIPGDVDSWAEVPVRVRKGVFMVKTFCHQNLGPNVVSETLELYLLSVPSSTGGPWSPRETAGDHRGQFPRTDFGLAPQT